MIELAIKGALERITGMNAYPLLLPDTVQEGVTFNSAKVRFIQQSHYIYNAMEQHKL